jgi:hypothetical protein
MELPQVATGDQDGEIRPQAKAGSEPTHGSTYSDRARRGNRVCGEVRQRR